MLVIPSQAHCSIYWFFGICALDLLKCMPLVLFSLKNKKQQLFACNVPGLVCVGLVPHVLLFGLSGLAYPGLALALCVLGLPLLFRLWPALACPAL